jgi:hypothetical protein
MSRIGKRPKQSFIKLWGLSFILLFSGACDSTINPDEEPLAQVHNKYLYLSEIQTILPDNATASDSTKFVNNYINTWVRKQLLVNQAEALLDEDSRNIARQVEDYRNSLLIYKYQQKLIQQKLDTVVTQQEIESYYNEYRSNFILPYNIVKALYIKLPKSSPDVDKVKQWYKSDEPEAQSRLQDYCYQYAVKYDHFNDEWINFKQVLSQIPTEIKDEDRFLRFRKYLETDDSLFYYYLRIKDYHLQGKEQPLSYAESRIRSIILNKRKFNFIEELENEVYNKALNRNEFVIY